MGVSVCVRAGGCLQPRGDLISEISLKLTKLSVKQSLVENRAECFWERKYKKGTLKVWEDMETVSVGLVLEKKYGTHNQKPSVL